MKKVLSCDLSLSGTALAVLVFDCGKLQEVSEIVFVNNKSNTALGHGARLSNIEQAIQGVFDKHPDLDYVVREKGFSRHAKVTQTLFKVVGVSDLVSFKNGKPFIDEQSPTTVKKYLTGNGRATKEQVENAIRKWLPPSQKGMIFKTDDCSDAVAVGIAWALEKKFLKN